MAKRRGQDGSGRKTRGHVPGLGVGSREPREQAWSQSGRETEPSTGSSAETLGGLREAKTLATGAVRTASHSNAAGRSGRIGVAGELGL